jgi:hypothetical protein
MSFLDEALDIHYDLLCGKKLDQKLLDKIACSGLKCEDPLVPVKLSEFVRKEISSKNNDFFLNVNQIVGMKNIARIIARLKANSSLGNPLKISVPKKSKGDIVKLFGNAYNVTTNTSEDCITMECTKSGMGPVLKSQWGEVICSFYMNLGEKANAFEEFCYGVVEKKKTGSRIVGTMMTSIAQYVEGGGGVSGKYLSFSFDDCSKEYRASLKGFMFCSKISGSTINCSMDSDMASIIAPVYYHKISATSTTTTTIPQPLNPTTPIPYPKDVPTKLSPPDLYKTPPTLKGPSLDIYKEIYSLNGVHESIKHKLDDAFSIIRAEIQGYNDSIKKTWDLLNSKYDSPKEDMTKLKMLFEELNSCGDDINSVEKLMGSGGYVLMAKLRALSKMIENITKKIGSDKVGSEEFERNASYIDKYTIIEPLAEKVFENTMFYCVRKLVQAKKIPLPKTKPTSKKRLGDKTTESNNNDDDEEEVYVIEPIEDDDIVANYMDFDVVSAMVMETVQVTITHMVEAGCCTEYSRKWILRLLDRIVFHMRENTKNVGDDDDKGGKKKLDDRILLDFLIGPKEGEEEKPPSPSGTNKKYLFKGVYYSGAGEIIGALFKQYSNTLLVVIVGVVLMKIVGMCTSSTSYLDPFALMTGYNNMCGILRKHVEEIVKTGKNTYVNFGEDSRLIYDQESQHIDFGAFEKKMKEDFEAANAKVKESKKVIDDLADSGYQNYQTLADSIAMIKNHYGNYALSTEAQQKMKTIIMDPNLPEKQRFAINFAKEKLVDLSNYETAKTDICTGLFGDIMCQGFFDGKEGSDRWRKTVDYLNSITVPFSNDMKEMRASFVYAAKKELIALYEDLGKEYNELAEPVINKTAGKLGDILFEKYGVSNHLSISEVYNNQLANIPQQLANSEINEQIYLNMFKNDMETLTNKTMSNYELQDKIQKSIENHKQVYTEAIRGATLAFMTHEIKEKIDGPSMSPNDASKVFVYAISAEAACPVKYNTAMRFISEFGNQMSFTSWIKETIMDYFRQPAPTATPAATTTTTTTSTSTIPTPTPTPSVTPISNATRDDPVIPLVILELLGYSQLQHVEKTFMRSISNLSRYLTSPKNFMAANSWNTSLSSLLTRFFTMAIVSLSTSSATCSYATLLKLVSTGAEAVGEIMMISAKQLYDSIPSVEQMTADAKTWVGATQSKTGGLVSTVNTSLLYQSYLYAGVKGIAFLLLGALGGITKYIGVTLSKFLNGVSAFLVVVSFITILFMWMSFTLDVISTFMSGAVLAYSWFQSNLLMNSVILTVMTVITGLFFWTLMGAGALYFIVKTFKTFADNPIETFNSIKNGLKLFVLVTTFTSAWPYFAAIWMANWVLAKTIQAEKIFKKEETPKGRLGSAMTYVFGSLTWYTVFLFIHHVFTTEWTGGSQYGHLMKTISEYFAGPTSLVHSQELRRKLEKDFDVPRSMLPYGNDFDKQSAITVQWIWRNIDARLANIINQRDFDDVTKATDATNTAVSTVIQRGILLFDEARKAITPGEMEKIQELMQLHSGSANNPKTALISDFIKTDLASLEMQWGTYHTTMTSV